MKFFKNPITGEVSAFEWPKDKNWAAPHLVEMTDAEVESHINPPPPIRTREDVEQIRLLAYADPVSGSDRHFAEQSAKAAIGDTEGATKAGKAGTARREEIQKDNPWPT